MTYSDWRKAHNSKLITLISSLPPMPLSALLDYFEYDHMHTTHPDFCGLYPSGTKCHNYTRLNCLFCACPHFHYSDTPTEVYGIKYFSSCSYGSTKAKQFRVDSSSHCDCSDCFLPHTRGHMSKLLEEVHTISDLISYLRRFNE